MEHTLVTEDGKMVSENEKERAADDIYNWLRHEKYGARDAVEIIKKLATRISNALRITGEREKEQ